MRAVRWTLGLLGAAALLLAGAVAALTLALDAGVLTPRLVAAIEGATGRAASLGAVSLRPGLTPRLAVEGASLANLPGGSRPEMARIRRMEARLALLPLLRGEVAFRRIAIEGAEILLERTAGGAPNWVFAPAPAGPAAPAAGGGPGRVEAGRRVVVDEVVLTDSRLVLPDARLGAVAVSRARAGGIGAGGPVAFEAALALHGVALEVTGEAAAGEGPSRASLAAGRNRILAEGAIGREIALTATLPEPAALRPLIAALAPALRLPAVLPPLEGALRLAPDLRPLALTLRAGPLDLAAVAPGLSLGAITLAMPALDRPAEVTLEGARAGLAFRARLVLDPPAGLLPWRPEAPVALTLTAEAAGARAEATGRVARPRAGRGAAFDLRATVPDLHAFAPLWPEAPALRGASLSARLVVADGAGGPWRIDPFRIEAPALQAEGALTLRPGALPRAEGRVAVARLDLDALGRRAAPAAAPAGAPPAAPAPSPAPPAPPAAAEARVIPDLPLPLAAARAWTGRVEIQAGQVVAGGATWRDLAAVIAAADGALRVEPFAVVTPGGPLRGRIRLDAGAAPPALAVQLASEGAGLDLGALRRARGEAAGLQGRAEIAIDLAGRGATTREVAATLGGEAGLAMIEGRLLAANLLRVGPDLARLLLPGAERQALDIRCLALRLSAEDGMAETRALLLETSAGRIDGAVAVNLREETLAAHLLPDVSLFGVTVRAPVSVGGTLAQPRIGADPARALGQVMRDTATNRLWRDPTVEWLRNRATAAHPAGDCAAQLRLARMGRDGPAPPPRPVMPGVPRELQGTTQDLLRGLGGLLGGGRR